MRQSRIALGFRTLMLLSLSGQVSWAANIQPANSTSTPAAPLGLSDKVAAAKEAPAALQSEATETQSAGAWIKKNFGLNYNSFFYGPGLTTSAVLPPDNTGLPADSGLYFWNLISLRWKFSERIALDLQLRNQLVVTEVMRFRHQGQRLGISGTLLKGDTWSLRGAINSDIPIRPILGQIPSDRTLIFNPGMFASFSWQPSGSRWSFFSLFTPRVFFYSDRSALAPQDISSGQGLNVKRELSLSFWPSINYAISDTVGWRFGAQVEFAKMVGWDSIRRNYMPIETGFTFNINEYLSIYPYLQVSTPLDDGLREAAARAKGVEPRSWTDSLALNVWLSGVFF